MNTRELFFRHLAQTSPAPLAIEIVKASGVTLYDAAGRSYIDLIGGISVCNTGHCHPEVVRALCEQAEQYLHVLVYGEMIQSPQVRYAQRLSGYLPDSLQTVYFTNSGAEATEAAMKLAKRATGRREIIAFHKSYHGSTQGALSILGDEYWRNAFRPLLPGITHLEYNHAEGLERITEATACVVAETIQAECGVRTPDVKWMQALRQRCSDTGALLVLDEIQVGFGRTGSLWAFEHFGILPDLLLLGKALGGGMPLGALVSDKKRMDVFTEQPVLGHITTFGGHPMSCAAGLASFEVLLKEKLTESVKAKEAVFRKRLIHDKIRAVRSAGLLIAVEFENAQISKRIIDACIERGLLTDWFLFAPEAMRIAPPLTMEKDQIEKACDIILDSIGLVYGR
jgi:acetylornithine/N-succinyldiaminopimelate aminotransferase